MKKLAIILLIGLYGLSASGMAIQLHYCCGKVASISLGYEIGNKAGCKHGMKMTMPGCCNNQQVSIDVDDDQGLANGVIIPTFADVYLPESFVATVQNMHAGNVQTVANIRGSPPKFSVPIYIFNQVFRN